MFVQRLNDVTAYTSAGEPILDTFAEVQQIWHPWRRRYDLFIRFVHRNAYRVDYNHHSMIFHFVQRGVAPNSLDSFRTTAGTRAFDILPIRKGRFGVFGMEF